MRELLPRRAPPVATEQPASLGGLFGRDVREVWLEIGFGGGEHLLWQAGQNPDVGLIGAEPFEDGVVKVLSAIEDDHLDNVLVHADDARLLLHWLPGASVNRAFILFPDPWPKRRHLKRRLVNSHLLRLLAHVLAPGSELRIGTDIGDYARTILMAFQRSGEFEWQVEGPDDWRQRPSDWPSTRYEQKAHREGRCCYYFRFIRRQGGL
ncbi:MAG: tRNA (guanosine(46)-N7)-methyltransferase TrmB [Hyphomicrobiaceae bacterium]